MDSIYSQIERPDTLDRDLPFITTNVESGGISDVDSGDINFDHRPFDLPFDADVVESLPSRTVTIDRVAGISGTRKLFVRGYTETLMFARYLLFYDLGIEDVVDLSKNTYFGKPFELLHRDRQHPENNQLFVCDINIKPRWSGEQPVNSSAEINNALFTTFTWYEIDLTYKHGLLLNPPRMIWKRSTVSSQFPKNKFRLTNSAGKPISETFIKYESTHEVELTVYETDFKTYQLAKAYFDAPPPIGKVNDSDVAKPSFSNTDIKSGKLMCIDAEDYSEKHYLGARLTRKYRFLYKTGADDNIWNKIAYYDAADGDTLKYTIITPSPYDLFSFVDLIPPDLNDTDRSVWFGDNFGRAILNVEG